MQPYARLRPGSTFPFDDRLLEIFLCITRLDEAQQRLPVFDKQRVVRPPSLLSRRRSVLLRNRLRAPGSYALVPSIWETSLPNGVTDGPFRLVLRVRSPPALFRVEAPSEEGWSLVKHAGS